MALFKSKQAVLALVCSSRYSSEDEIRPRKAVLICSSMNWKTYQTPEHCGFYDALGREVWCLISLIQRSQGEQTFHSLCSDLNWSGMWVCTDLIGQGRALTYDWVVTEVDLTWTLSGWRVSTPYCTNTAISLNGRRRLFFNAVLTIWTQTWHCIQYIIITKQKWNVSQKRKFVLASKVIIPKFFLGFLQDQTHGTWSSTNEIKLCLF